MPVPTDELTRLSTGAPTGYNNDPYNASTNPYGFADGGYITNFFAALNDLTVVSLWVTDEIAPLVDITTEIEALGAIVADLTALAAIIPDVSALAALDTQITALGAITADITTVATNVASVTAVATDIAKVAAVEAALSDIEAVSAALTNISTVVGMAADITTLVARATDIATLADIEDGTEATGAISTVAGIATAVSNVSTNSADVVSVAGALSEINTLAGISADVTAAGAVADDIAAVASISADVQTVADNIADVQAAPAAAVAARKSVRHIIFDSGTADAHPGSGHFRLSFDVNAATVGQTGTMYHDITDADAGTITEWIESWDDVINATGRGNISLVGEADPSISAMLRVTGAVTSGSSYRKIPVTLLQKSVVGGSFADEAEFTEIFSANGNDAGGGAGSGDVTSTGSITSGNLVRYADGTGDVIEDTGKAVSDFFDLGANDLDDIPDGSTYVRYTATEQTKLSGIEAAADVTDAGNVGSTINGATGKTTPVDADTMPLIDSAASNVLKKVTWANIKATLKTYFDTLYSAIGHVHTFASLTSKPTTLSGYGITDAQPLDSDLTTIAALTATSDNFMVANSSAWASRTPAQALVHLGITATAAEVNALDGITATVTELNYTDGVTSAIQTQLDGKQPLNTVRRHNAIINGDFDIWQRATSQTAVGYGSDDRWNNSTGGSTKTHSQQEHTLGQTTVPGNPRYFSRTVVTSSAGASNQVSKYQRIEGVKTFQNETVTFTFWAKADASKNIAVEFAQVFGSGGSPSSAVTGIGVTTCALTASWQKFSFTVSVPSISGKTLGTDGKDALQVVFWLDAGSSFNSRTNSLGQQSGTFDISHVSLVRGDATAETDPFEMRSLAEEIALCQRYYLDITANVASMAIIEGYMATSTSFRGRIITPVPMRAAPTLTLGGTPNVIANGGASSSLSSITTGINASGLVEVIMTTGALTGSHAAALVSASSATLDCEL